MDEGFTSYASTIIMDHLKSTGLLGRIQTKEGEQHLGAVNGYINFARSGYEEPMSTHADHFGTNAAYAVAAYVKGQVYLVQMRYLIGEEMLMKVLRRYYNEWQFKHPTPNDFLRIAEKESNLELYWFNEYFVNSTHVIDYSIDSVYSQDGNTIVELSRAGSMPMPLDIEVQLHEGEHVLYNIPLRMMRGAKTQEGEKEYKVLTDWPWTHKSYTMTINENIQDIKSIVIDSSGRLADIDRDNNEWQSSISP
jgi:aminopeptidase N